MACLKRFPVLVALLGIYSTLAEEVKSYKLHEEVPVITNKIGPFANPSETYQYYTLPFCAPAEMEHQSHGLGEVLAGDRKVKTPYEINFLANIEWRVLCKKTLKRKEIAQFEQAVENEYYFEMFVDSLPFWGLIGDVEQEDLLLGHTASSHHYIYTHLHFNISYNGDKIIAVNVLSPASYRVDITSADEIDVQFTYRVTWTKTTDEYSTRQERYVKMHFLPQSFEIHWLSIVNSFVLVILLTAFLAIILMRVLKNDCTRYMAADEEEDLGEEESGWKLIHGDVFRFPKFPMLFSACIGVGAQMFVLTSLLVAMALLSVFSPNKRGAVATACIVLYALTSGIGGYVSARLFRQLGGTEWVWNTVLTTSLIPAPFLLLFSFLNSVAISAGSTAALPFGTIMIVLALFLLVSFPLTLIGAIAGRNTAGDLSVPCRTKKVARQIPDVPWYRKGVAQMFMAGFLPFSAIYIELHYIFASVWGHKIYTLFGILSVAFLMLLIVTSFITIALTYFQVQQANYARLTCARLTCARGSHNCCLPHVLPCSHSHSWRSKIIVGGGVLSSVAHPPGTSCVVLSWLTLCHFCSFCFALPCRMFVLAYSFFYYFERSEMSGFMQTAYFFGYMTFISYAFSLMLGFVGFYSSLAFVRRIYEAIKAE